MCTFDAGDLDAELFSRNFLNQLAEVAKGIYIVGKNELVKFRGENCPYLERYQDLFSARIKPQFRSQRETIVIELKDLKMQGLRYKGCEIIPSEQRNDLHVVLTLDKIGVGCLSYWLKLPAPMNIEMSRGLRDPSNLRATVTLESQHFNYTGELSFYQIIELLMCMIFSKIHSDKLHGIDICKSLLDGKNADTLRAEICGLIDPESNLCQELVFYPVYFVEMALTIKEISSFRESNAKQIRAILTGDRNWQRKKTKLIQKQVFELDKSSADSVIWLTDTDGTVKLFSSEFETDPLSSKILTMFELEILLTEKFFLHTVNYNLSRITEEKWTPKRLSDFREEVIEKLDRYYNIDISQKDTTRSRLEDLKNILHIDYLYEVAMAKFEGLSKKIEAYYEIQSARRDLLLTLIIGVFGVGALVHTFLTPISKPEDYPIVIFLTLVSMVASFLFLYGFLRGHVGD